MAKIPLSLFAACMLPAQALAAAPAAAQLAPNAYLQWEFPQLPPTFFAQKTGNASPAQMSVRLPSNYSADKKFPLFVFLQGGDGGPATRDALGGSHAILGDADFIKVALPLFKKNLDPQTDIQNELVKELPPGIPPAIAAGLQKMATGGIVMSGDYETIRAAYTEMLGKLHACIPNIDTSRSVLIGFSNGAHTIGVLLKKKDPFILEHFHAFCMVEGGMEMMLTPDNTLGGELKAHRLLLLVGDGGSEDKNGFTGAPRPYILQIVQNYAAQARARGVDCTLEVMQNTGHSLNPAYRPLIKQWALGAQPSKP